MEGGHPVLDTLDPLIKEYVHPEDNANLFTKIMVSWVTPLITLAGQQQLLDTDVWETPSNQSVKTDYDTVWDAWMDETEKAVAENREPSLSQALFLGFGKEFRIAGILQAMFMFSQIAQPYLVGELVSFVKFGGGGIQYGVGISIALLVVSLISSLSFTGSFNVLRRLGVSVRSGIMMAVYEKSLKLTSASRMQNTIGQTTNLMSIDAEKLFISVQFVHFVWQGPVANIIVMFLIIQDVGVGPALLGLASQLALIPIQNYLADTIGKVRRSMVKHTDERVKLMNEILQAIRIIKVYAWEIAMEKRVMEVRKKEIKGLNMYLSLNCVLREMLFLAGPIANIVIFTSFVYAFGQQLTLVEMFRVSAFINILRLPSNLLGQALKNLR
jgi:ATP-binding cassette subfamily C (CFTR/MRP) protein 1